METKKIDFYNGWAMIYTVSTWWNEHNKFNWWVFTRWVDGQWYIQWVFDEMKITSLTDEYLQDEWWIFTK